MYNPITLISYNNWEGLHGNLIVMIKNYSIKNQFGGKSIG